MYKLVLRTPCCSPPPPPPPPYTDLSHPLTETLTCFLSGAAPEDCEGEVEQEGDCEAGAEQEMADGSDVAGRVGRQGELVFRFDPSHAAKTSHGAAPPSAEASTTPAPTLMRPPTPPCDPLPPTAPPLATLRPAAPHPYMVVPTATTTATTAYSYMAVPPTAGTLWLFPGHVPHALTLSLSLTLILTLALNNPDPGPNPNQARAARRDAVTAARRRANPTITL